MGAVAWAPTAALAAGPVRAGTGGLREKTGRLIWLHGLGDTAEGWGFLPRYLQSAGLDHVEFVMPTAPTIPITVNGGQFMPGWFDMAEVPYAASSEDDRGSIESIGVARLTALIEAAEAEGVPADRVVVGGFSQGGCVAMVAGLAYPKTLAGIAALSGWLPAYLRGGSAALGASSAARPPVLWGHGEADRIVTFEAAKLGPPALQRAGVEDLEFRSFPGLGHGAADEELAWLADWLKKRVPPLS